MKPNKTNALAAAAKMDWQQVVLNAGPPCFHLDASGKFCGRAHRWPGHPDDHVFISLADLIYQITSKQPKTP